MIDAHDLIPSWTETESRVFGLFIDEFSPKEEITITEEDVLKAYKRFKFCMELLPKDYCKLSFEKTETVSNKSQKDLRFLTEFTNQKGVVYGWHVYAPSWEEAQKEADERGIGEKVIGFQEV